MSTARNPEHTRLRILKAAFSEIYKHGFQGMRVDTVLAHTGLKKGALYHHFSSKQALGYAVLEEVIEKHITEIWIEPLQDFDNPLEGLKTIFVRAGEAWKADYFNLGCPLNNLAQEMSPIDEGFRERIQRFFRCWQNTIAQALLRGQEKGFVRSNIDAQEVAGFIITVIEGAFGFAKIAQDKELFFKCGEQLSIYLDMLSTNAATPDIQNEQNNGKRLYKTEVAQ
ncbi:MAG: TetR/AcrR family transcriptional regulator [Gammaproteobacteria bacterium]